MELNNVAFSSIYDMKTRRQNQIQYGDPDKCSGHVWRHLCVTTRAGNSSKRNNCRGIAAGCKKIICVNCGGLDTDRREYQCFKCNRYFSKFRYLDTDKPTCDDCFKKLLSIKSATAYVAFVTQKEG
jgi:hypothetical protein